MGDRIYVGSWGADGLNSLLEMSDEECREMGHILMEKFIEMGLMSLDENDKIIWHGVKKPKGSNDR